MSKSVVIIGCGAAGWSAAFAARKTSRESQVIVLEQGKDPMYERGGIPFVIQGVVPNFEALIPVPQKQYQMMNIDLRTETQVTQIDALARNVTVQNLKREESQISFDSLVLTTGAEPIKLPIRGHTLPQVYGVRTLDDGRAIFDHCAVANSAVVIGAKLVGLEMAVALRHHGVEVTVVELLPQIFDGVLDRTLAQEVQEALEHLGIHFILETPVSEILGEDRVQAVSAGSQNIPADMVIMATGVRARTELAQQIGVTLSDTQLIQVTERMETNKQEIYAAGDCIECFHAITKKPVISQLGSNAIRQGKVAGTNAAGGSMRFPDVLGACVTRLGEIEIASTGLTEAYATKEGINCASAYVKAMARSPCYPEKVMVQVKLIADQTNGRVIGAQIISNKEIGPRIDALSLAIKKEASIDDLILFDHAYSPAVTDSTDPFSVAAETLSRKL